jgi:hypothetical protein
VPCGIDAQKQDEQLSIVYKNIHQKEFDFFSEHARHGLPTKEEISAGIEKAANTLDKRLHITSIGTLNLRLRDWLMRGWISDNPLVNIFFRKLLLPFIPLLRLFNAEPTYRQIFFVTLNT